MKFALIFVAFAICASCAIAQNITSWGDVHNTWVVREETVVVPYQFFRRQNRTVTFRTVCIPDPVGLLVISHVSKN